MKNAEIKYTVEQVKIHRFSCFKVKLFKDGRQMAESVFNSEAQCVTWALKNGKKI